MMLQGVVAIILIPKENIGSLPLSSSGDKGYQRKMREVYPVDGSWPGPNHHG